MAEKQGRKFRVSTLRGKPFETTAQSVDDLMRKIKEREDVNFNEGTMQVRDAKTDSVIDRTYKFDQDDTEEVTVVNVMAKRTSGGL